MPSQQPLLFILSPQDISDHHLQESTTVFKAEDLHVQNVLVANQLRFFSRKQQKVTPIQFNLVDGEILIGKIISYNGAQVCIEANGQQIVFNGNDIKKIERIK